MEKTTDLKSESVKSTTDDPTRVTESKLDDGTKATIGGPASADELVSQPGAKNAVWQKKEEN